MNGSVGIQLEPGKQEAVDHVVHEPGPPGSPSFGSSADWLLMEAVALRSQGRPSRAHAPEHDSSISDQCHETRAPVDCAAGNDGGGSDGGGGDGGGGDGGGAGERGSRHAHSRIRSKWRASHVTAEVSAQ